jgi:hypothetical protein
MKRLLFVLSLVMAQAFAQEAPRGVIRGVVQRAETAEAIDGADITVEVAGVNVASGGASGAAAHLKTDRDGRFEVTGVPTGRYRVSVRREGYFSSSREGNAEEVVSVSVGADGNASDVSILLVPAGVISGRVIDGFGELLPKANVRAFTVTREGGRDTLKPAATDFSDHRGEFRLFWLPPGEYVVQAEPPGSATGTTGLSLKAFHPNVIELAYAARIELKAGDSRSGIDITLPSAMILPATKTFRISGQVLSTLTADGRAQPAASVLMLLPHDAMDQTSPRNAGVSDSRTGRFEISPVAPGVYDLYARVQDPRGSPSRRGVALAWGRTGVEVGDADANNVRLLVHPSVTVSGIVRLPGDAAALVPGLRVELEPVGSAAKLETVRGMTDASRGLKPDGTFTISAVAEGDYKVRLRGLPADGYSVEVRQGSGDVTDAGINVTPATPPPLELIVQRRMPAH